MKIAVMGTGGVGGYFGGLLARADEDVTFIARGPHLDAIRRNGLKVESDLTGEFVVNAVATNDIASVGHVDVVLYTVKMYHNEQAISAITPMIGPNTRVLTLQNGIDNGDKLAEIHGKDHVLVGIAVVQSLIKEPGVIWQRGQLGRIVFGEIDGGITPQCEQLYDVFKNGGWNVELSDNAMAALWQKFIYLTAAAEVNAATQITYGEMRTIPETRELIFSAWREIAAVGKAKGASIDDGIIDWCANSLDQFPEGAMTSLGNDFKLGNPVELEGLTGTVVRMGRETGVPTPVHDTLYAILKPAALRIEQARN